MGDLKMVKKKEHSQEFLERRELQKKEKEIAKFKHNLIMEKLKFERETNRLFHERNLERGRITRAEDRKLFWEKQNAYRR